MIYNRMPGAVPIAYVNLVVKIDKAGKPIGTLQVANAPSVEAGSTQMPEALTRGRDVASHARVPFYVQCRDEDWDSSWGELRDDFTARSI